MSRRIQYDSVLANFPVPGEGNGSHSKLLTCANYAHLAGRSEEHATKEIFAAIPTCGRKQISIPEVEEAVLKAYHSRVPQMRPQISRKKLRPKGKPDLKAFVDGSAITHQELSQLSPVSIEGGCLEESILLLECLFDPDDNIFIGTQYESTDNILLRDEWIAKVRDISVSDVIVDLPHIVPNPLTGLPGITKSGKQSYRCDDCVASFKFAIAEFDNLSCDQQLAFWHSAIKKGFPVAALIDSGGKSIHGWLRVNCENREEWERQIEQKLFPELLVPLGCDSSCRNESRLSRFPGHYRDEKKKMQHLLYLNPEANK